MGKFATVIKTDLRLFEGKEEELAELNKERMQVLGYKSDSASVVICPHCNKTSLVGPHIGRDGKLLDVTLLLGWKRKQTPRDLAAEANPPDESEIKAKEELEKAQAAFDEAQADIGKLLQKFSKRERGHIDSRGEYVEPKSQFADEAEALLMAAQDIRDKAGVPLQKARIRYNDLHGQRMRRIEQYRRDEEQKAMAKLEKAKQAKKGKNWRGKIKKIVSK